MKYQEEMRDPRIKGVYKKEQPPSPRAVKEMMFSGETWVSKSRRQRNIHHRSWGCKETGLHSTQWKVRVWYRGREVGDWATKKQSSDLSMRKLKRMQLKERTRIARMWSDKYVTEGESKGNQDVKLVVGFFWPQGCLRINLAAPLGTGTLTAGCTQLQPYWIIPPAGSSLVSGEVLGSLKGVCRSKLRDLGKGSGYQLLPQRQDN